MRKPLILIVDDDELLLKTIHDALVMEGFRVITATNAVTALFLLGKRNPDLVLLDIMMPEYNGFQALETIRQHSDIPVIMLTCLNDPNSLKKAMDEKGADDYITKPFSLNVLVAHIKAKLRRADTAKHHLVSAENYQGRNTDEDR
jgi:DNA-binding response OmpR family regulator